MKIEEAMVYLLATSQHGMKTEQIARELELRGLVPRRAGRSKDVTGYLNGNQVNVDAHLLFGKLNIKLISKRLQELRPEGRKDCN